MEYFKKELYEQLDLFNRMNFIYDYTYENEDLSDFYNKVLELSNYILDNNSDINEAKTLSIIIGTCRESKLEKIKDKLERYIRNSFK